MEDKSTAIVVGAGPAGCAAAYTLAKSGLDVLLLERGQFAGAKNVTGGILYGAVMDKLIPGFWKDAPVERRVSHHITTILSEGSSLSIDFSSVSGSKPPHNGFTVLRSRFDQWFARKAEEAGAILATGLRVDDVIWKDDRVAGILAGGDEFYSDVVILADGVNSILAQKAGLRGELSPEDINQGVKEVIELPREVIEERFHLTGDEGAAIECLGFCTRGIHGGGFLYTNKDFLSLGIVVQLKGLVESGLKSAELLDGFKTHPYIAPLIKGGKTVEYSAHLIPASGLKMMPRLYGEGLLVAGDAAALVLGTGRALEGVNFAIASGIAAAETVKIAKKEEDFSEESLSQYNNFLSQSFVLQDLNTFRGAPHFMDNPRLYKTYPDLICHLAEKIFTVDGNPKKKVMQIAREEMKGKVSMLQLIRDGISGARSI